MLVTFSLMSIIWLTQSLRFVSLITNNGIAVSTFAEMTSLLMPRIFTILAPISLFASVLFVYNRMLSDRELVVMKAAGISPWANAKPALIFGFIMVLFNSYVYNYGIPWAERTFNELEWKVKNDVSHLMFREGEFTSMQDGLTIFITTHEKDGSISGILVNDERNPQNKVTLSAERGRVVYTDEGPKIIMVNGARQEINSKTNQFTSIFFERYSVDFGIKETRGRKAAGVREKTLAELFSAKENSSLTEKEKNRYIVEGNRRVLNPFYNILFSLLACTGLLVGNFNRRGQTKIISLSIACMVIIQAMELSFENLAAKHLSLLPLMYTNLLIPLLICIWFLRCYNPATFMRKKGFADER